MTTFGDQLFHLGGTPVNGGGGGGIPSTVRRAYFVDGTAGLDGNTGRSWGNAFKTIQRACTMANSAEEALYDTDIYIGRGLYEETVELTRVGSGLGSGVMLWASGGQTAAGIGMIRLIANENVFLHNGTSGTAPTLYIGRPNVEVHNFGTIKLTNTTGIAGGEWSSPEGYGGTIAHGMPAIFIERNYNASTYLDGAANKVKVVNCRVNGNAANQGCILVMGSSQVFVLDCIIEYGHEYGIAMCGSSVGSTAENLIKGCIFNQNTGTDIHHGSLVTSWIMDCLFANPNATAHLSKHGSEANAVYCTMSGCSIPSATALTKVISAGNSTFACSHMYTGHATNFIGDSDLAS